jgi:hypothetical protein
MICRRIDGYATRLSTSRPRSSGRFTQGEVIAGQDRASASLHRVPATWTTRAYPTVAALPDESGHYPHGYGVMRYLGFINRVMYAPALPLQGHAISGFSSMVSVVRERRRKLGNKFAHYLKLADSRRSLQTASKASHIAAVASGSNAPCSLKGLTGMTFTPAFHPRGWSQIGHTQKGARQIIILATPLHLLVRFIKSAILAIVRGRSASLLTSVVAGLFQTGRDHRADRGAQWACSRTTRDTFRDGA